MRMNYSDIHQNPCPTQCQSCGIQTSPTIDSQTIANYATIGSFVLAAIALFSNR